MHKLAAALHETIAKYRKKGISDAIIAYKMLCAWKIMRPFIRILSHISTWMEKRHIDAFIAQLHMMMPMFEHMLTITEACLGDATSYQQKIIELLQQDFDHVTTEFTDGHMSLEIVHHNEYFRLANQKIYLQRTARQTLADDVMQTIAEACKKYYPITAFRR